ncbi:glutathione S-transferase family protein [Pseudomonas tolaasii]|uniref:glutathione S-transferase family protein n=1 Tax=Pseudomonas tolaasii TaxID=29442 RepID=UPI001C57B021|nr:glutathione binding-like protein [Pseudomonas tolaasii]MBW1248769.1 glutathione S-transferase family protein [Pseudomonas tolaasii]
MQPSKADLRIFSYAANPRLWKASIAARLKGVNVDVIGAPVDELYDWLWDFDARPMDDTDRYAMRELLRPARRGLANGMLYKTEAFLDAHPFGTIPAAFSPDGAIGIFESNSIMRLVARLAVGPVQLVGNGPYERSRVDSFLDASLVFSHDLQRYMLALRAGRIDIQLHSWAKQALESYLSGIERTLRPGRSYLVGNAISIADICFVCEFAIISNEQLFESVLSLSGLHSIVRRELASIYPLAFQHFSKLCRHPAFIPDLVAYQSKFRSPPFSHN